MQGHRLRARHLLAAFFVSAVGCASVDARHVDRVDTSLPSPGFALVYDFDVTAREVAPDESPPPEAEGTEHERMARQAKHALAEAIVEGLRTRGIEARRAQPGPISDDQGALLVRGWLESVEAGTRVGRIAVGFGARASHVEASVVVYRNTPYGRISVLSFSTEAHAGHMPAAVSGDAPAGREALTGVAEQIHGTAEAVAEQIAAFYVDQDW